MQEQPPQGHLGEMGVAVVSYRSGAIIHDCLTSLATSRDVRLRVVVIDNASDDDTVAQIRAWAAAQAPGFVFEEAAVGAITCAKADLTLLHSPANRGFAEATNRGLEVLLADPALKLFWLLNPDARARPDTARHYLVAGDDGRFALMGGRTVFAASPGAAPCPEVVQTDGGRVSRWTGKCTSVNWGKPAAQAAMPAAQTLDFITGANCVASRRFIEQVGLMREDYFLYYEEVDWALRRGNLALRVVPQAVVEHLGGTSIGSANAQRRSTPLANYFSYRSRMRFLRRFSPLAIPLGAGFAVLKAVQLLVLKRAGDEAGALLAGAFGLAPPRKVCRQLSGPAPARHAAGPKTDGGN